MTTYLNAAHAVFAVTPPRPAHTLSSEEVVQPPEDTSLLNPRCPRAGHRPARAEPTCSPRWGPGDLRFQGESRRRRPQMARPRTASARGREDARPEIRHLLRDFGVFSRVCSNGNQTASSSSLTKPRWLVNVYLFFGEKRDTVFYIGFCLFIQRGCLQGPCHLSHLCNHSVCLMPISPRLTYELRRDRNRASCWHTPGAWHNAGI